MNRVLIWDIPVRLLHLVLAGSLGAALILALGFDDDHPLFVYHAWFGMLAGGALAVRVALGFLGSRHARFSGWSWSPRELAGFFRALARGERRPGRAGHNPAASWVMLGMLALTAAVLATGLAGGEDLHEAAAYALLAFIGLHLAGLVFHTVRHREPIMLAMVDGRKEAPAEDALRHASWLGGACVALALAAWGTVLARGFNAADGTVRLPFLSRPVSLVENEGGEGRSGAGEHGSHRDRDDD